MTPYADARRAVEIPIRRAAHLLGVTPTHLSRVERGEEEPDPTLLRRMGALYGVMTMEDR
jgi:transcriptional regulator with XRE-family HTH domain